MAIREMPLSLHVSLSIFFKRLGGDVKGRRGRREEEEGEFTAKQTKPAKQAPVSPLHGGLPESKQ